MGRRRSTHRTVRIDPPRYSPYSRHSPPTLLTTHVSPYVVRASVCIGRELDHEAARLQLEACLVTDEEMAGDLRSLLMLHDPFPPWPCAMVGRARGRLREDRKMWRKNQPQGFVAKPLNMPDGAQDILNWYIEPNISPSPNPNPNPTPTLTQAQTLTLTLTL